MKLFVKLGAAAAVAACTWVSSAVQAQPWEDPGYEARRRQSLREYCYNHPYSDRCEDYRYRLHRRATRPSYGNGYGGRCVGSSVHSVGKAWIPYAVARNSAIKAWEKETRVEYGSEYANWDHAEGKSIQCGPSGGLGTLCEAKGRPCL